jgi:hypothetical protein
VRNRLEVVARRVGRSKEPLESGKRRRVFVFSDSGPKEMEGRPPASYARQDFSCLEENKKVMA